MSFQISVHTYSITHFLTLLPTFCGLHKEFPATFRNMGFLITAIKLRGSIGRTIETMVVALRARKSTTRFFMTSGTFNFIELQIISIF